MWKMMASASSCLVRLRFVVKVHLRRSWRRRVEVVEGYGGGGGGWRRVAEEESVEAHLASGQGEGVERREVKTRGHNWSPSCRGP